MSKNTDLKTIQNMLFKEYQKNGYHKIWTNGFMNNNPHQNIFDIAELGLITTEVSEAIEEIRKPLTDISLVNLGFECADIIIRTINFMTRKGMNLDFFLNEKYKHNLLRGKLHDKQI